MGICLNAVLYSVHISFSERVCTLMRFWFTLLARNAAVFLDQINFVKKI